MFKVLSFYLAYPLVVMATVINEEQGAVAFKKAGSDILFPMDRKQVDSDFQAKLYHIGIVSLESFAVFAKTQDDSEGLLKEYFELDPKDITHRVKAGRVITAWIVAKTWSTKQAELDGECEARKVPKDIGI